MPSKKGNKKNKQRAKKNSISKEQSVQETPNSVTATSPEKTPDVRESLVESETSNLDLKQVVLLDSLH